MSFSRRQFLRLLGAIPLVALAKRLPAAPKPDPLLPLHEGVGDDIQLYQFISKRSVGRSLWAESSLCDPNAWHRDSAIWARQSGKTEAKWTALSFPNHPIIPSRNLNHVKS